MSSILWFNQIGMQDIGKVGGKNASLGEMIQHLTQADLRVPDGFATTAEAFRLFLQENNLTDKINNLLEKLDVNNLKALEKTGKTIRSLILKAHLSDSFKQEIEAAYKELGKDSKRLTFAVRSSATAEDLPDASFAGQQETYLNVKGLKNLLKAIKMVFASLYNDRAIVYRVQHGFKHSQVAISVGVQRMIRSDLACSGVTFSIDTESGFKDVVFITAAYGLGETVVQGKVNPDEFYLYKPNLKTNNPAILTKTVGQKAIKMVYGKNGKKVKTISVSPKERSLFTLTDDELTELAKATVTIEDHYGKPMDVEWAKDGIDGKIYIVQARPETVKSQQKSAAVLKQYDLEEKGKVIVEGRSIGQQIGVGSAAVLNNLSEMSKFKKGDVLVTDMTDPDWEPIMKKSAAIVTNRGGRTCHAAIVARELGIPAVVGCGNATTKIREKQMITISCCEGDAGYVYDGKLKYKVDEMNVEQMPKIPTKIMINMANPEQAFAFSMLPNHGVGLARLEFIINSLIGVHPNAVLNFNKLPAQVKKKIAIKTVAYKNPVDFYVSKLREGIATICAAFYPKPVILRTSDFKSNEYANLLGGQQYEPAEENPMIGFRGASRYVDDAFCDCFALECEAIRQVRDEMGLTNLQVMIPFCRTVEEGLRVLKVMEENGLKRGVNDLKVIMMCEIPSNAILAEAFLKHFDGFSIGSNDLTQLTLGLDRDSNIISYLFDERNDAVKHLIAKAIETCLRLNKYIGICGQAPSDYPDFAQWLLEQKIGSMSLNSDTVVKTWLYLAKS